MTVSRVSVAIGSLGLAAVQVLAQSTPAFEVATIRVSAPLDFSAPAPRQGAHIGPVRASFNRVSFKQLVATAYRPNLEPRKVVMEVLIIDRAEKTPVEE
jgi:hypothetical protein